MAHRLKSKISLVLRSSYSTKKLQFEIKAATSERYTEILELLWNGYYPYDPTTKGLGLGSSEISTIDDHITNVLMENTSLIADLTPKKLIGCTISTVTNENTPLQIIKYAQTIEDQRTCKLLNLYAYLTAGPALFKRFATKEIFEIRQLCVDAQYKDDEVAYELIKKSVNIGHKLGHNVVRCNATTKRIAQMCTLLGMEKICVIPYALYVDKDKNAILKIQQPEVSCQVFVDVL